MVLQEDSSRVQELIVIKYKTIKFTRKTDDITVEE